MAKRNKKDYYTVKRGDSWFKIAGRLFKDAFGGDEVAAQRMAFELAQANRGIEGLRPGMRIAIPRLPRGRRADEPFVPIGWGGVEAYGEGQQRFLESAGVEMPKSQAPGAPGAPPIGAITSMVVDDGGGGGAPAPSGPSGPSGPGSPVRPWRRGPRRPGRPGYRPPKPKPPAWTPPTAFQLSQRQGNLQNYYDSPYAQRRPRVKPYGKQTPINPATGEAYYPEVAAIAQRTGIPPRFWDQVRRIMGAGGEFTPGDLGRVVASPYTQTLSALQSVGGAVQETLGIDQPYATPNLNPRAGRTPGYQGRRQQEFLNASPRRGRFLEAKNPYENMINRGIQPPYLYAFAARWMGISPEDLLEAGYRQDTWGNWVRPTYTKPITTSNLGGYGGYGGGGGYYYGGGGGYRGGGGGGGGGDRGKLVSGYSGIGLPDQPIGSFGLVTWRGI